ncbi:hypothetical protein TNCT6_12520 [Streptomyces sp. 6-11-2]|nr:hypothetical protein TNCT6_12520 [Streptomyces sp. 6-11-2]
MVTLSPGAAVAGALSTSTVAAAAPRAPSTGRRGMGKNLRGDWNRSFHSYPAPSAVAVTLTLRRRVPVDHLADTA